MSMNQPNEMNKKTYTSQAYVVISNAIHAYCLILLPYWVFHHRNRLMPRAYPVIQTEAHPSKNEAHAPMHPSDARPVVVQGSHTC